MVALSAPQARLDPLACCMQPRPLVDGLVWRGEWRAPCEGALTLLWKIALANCLTPRELCRILFGMHLLSGDPSGTHGRTLLTPRWIVNPKGSVTVLGGMVRCAGLDKTSSRWAEVVASDEHIRYCKSCLADGYQSAYCQIDGLRTCPVHGLPLLDVCTACGATTPRYALTSLTMATPYCCHVCGEPLARPAWSPIIQGQDPTFFHRFVAYRALEQWLSSVETLEMTWPHLSSWQCCGEGAQGNVERRIAVFGILGQLVPLSLKEGCCRESADNVSLGIHIVSMPESLVQLRCIEPVEKWDSRRSVYKAIRRRVRRLLMHHHRRCLREGGCAMHVEWGSEVLSPVAPVCPLVLAYYLWRHHFECDVAVPPPIGSRKQEFGMRGEALSWPADREVKTETWAKFAVMSFIAFLQVAREWCERTEQVVDDDGQINFTDMLQLLADFRASLSPKYKAWSSRISFFELKTQEEHEDRIAIVGPIGRLHDILSQQHLVTNPPGEASRKSKST